ncbi:class I SAM-dependent methyltransferase [Nonomuraea gerenzanensis]|uniref:class I SAM-dependent methyltransferase n=1 Tax=Nonomuraea gerenzanensis TaxID=93944 RepID=UPI001CD99E04|nr:class I SAM-dependent methyltransferase [Nonomuraea gerenzanensis]UBU16695.1 class I SAM-dependent methyltransferase [Nonomuraea gerenzanensis]
MDPFIAHPYYIPSGPPRPWVRTLMRWIGWREVTMGAEPYRGLADDYHTLLGDLAEHTWRVGILPEAVSTRPRPSAVVVDLGAGTGIGGRLLATHLPQLTRIGVDRSAAMLAQAADAYEHTLLSSIDVLPLSDESADLMVSGFDTLNYLPIPALGQCLREVARCLRPGGRLIADLSSPHLLRCHWRDHNDVQEFRDGTVHWHHRYDPERDRCVSVVERRDAAHATCWRETHTQYAVDADQLHDLADAAGMHVERVRDLESDRYNPATFTHVWTLRKKAR